MELCGTGMPLVEACAKLSISRSKFYAHRYIVELSVVDRDAYEAMLYKNFNTPMLQLNRICKVLLAEKPRRDKMFLVPW